MAKKSKIVRNEQRRVIVARYAQRRAELKESSVHRRARVNDGWPRNASWRASPVTPARCACATATPLTGDRAGICANSDCRGCGSASCA